MKQNGRLLDGAPVSFRFCGDVSETEVNFGCGGGGFQIVAGACEVVDFVEEHFTADGYLIRKHVFVSNTGKVTVVIAHTRYVHTNCTGSCVDQTLAQIVTGAQFQAGRVVNVIAVNGNVGVFVVQTCA